MSFVSTVVNPGNEEGIAPVGYGSNMPYEYNGNLYILTIKATAQDIHFVHILKSVDGGNTWAHLLDGPLVYTATSGGFRYVDPFAHARLANVIHFFYSNPFGTEPNSGFSGTLAAMAFNLATETLTSAVTTNYLPYRYRRNIITLVWERLDTSGGAGKIRAWSRPDGTILVVTEGLIVAISGDTINPSQNQDYSFTYNGTVFTTPVQIATGNNPQYSVLSGVVGSSGLTHVIVRETTSSTGKVHYGRFDSFNNFTIVAQISDAGTIQENYCYFQDGNFYLCFTFLGTGSITYAVPQLFYGTDSTSPTTASIIVTVSGLAANDVNRAFCAIFPIGGCWCCFIIIRNTADPSYRVYRSRRHSTFVWEPFQLLHSVFNHTGLLNTCAMIHSGLVVKAVFGKGSGLYTLSSSPDPDTGGIHFAELEISASSTCGAPTINVSDAMSMSDFVQRTLTSVGGGGQPPIIIDECPDIVASSACAFVKTINDSEDSLTDCEEEVFSETALPCD